MLRRVLVCFCALLIGITVGEVNSTQVAGESESPQLERIAWSSISTFTGREWDGLRWRIARSDAWYDGLAQAAADQAAAEKARTHSPKARATGSGGHHKGYATARECVENTENGGDYGRSTNPGHFGREQWSRSAWESYGGDPNTWGSASPEEQDRVFDNAWSQGPAVQEQQWLRWDGC